MAKDPRIHVNFLENISKFLMIKKRMIAWKIYSVKQPQREQLNVLCSFTVISTCMKISEVMNAPQTYMATVRVVLRNGPTTVRTTVTADTFQQARLILTRIYGEGNVLGLRQLMSEEEEVTEATKALSPQELQVKSLSDRAKQLNQQAKQLKARQQTAKAQQSLMKASQSSPQLSN